MHDKKFTIGNNSNLLIMVGVNAWSIMRIEKFIYIYIFYNIIIAIKSSFFLSFYYILLFKICIVLYLYWGCQFLTWFNGSIRLDLEWSKSKLIGYGSRIFNLFEIEWTHLIVFFGLLLKFALIKIKWHKNIKNNY